MSKLKLNLAHEAGEILTKEEMKMVTGGAGSGSTGSVTKQFYRCYCYAPGIGMWEGYYTSYEAAEATIPKYCSNQKGACTSGS